MNVNRMKCGGKRSVRANQCRNGAVKELTLESWWSNRRTLILVACSGPWQSWTWTLFFQTSCIELEDA